MLKPTSVRASAAALVIAVSSAETLGAQNTALLRRLDSLAGAGVAEKRAVGLGIAVVKGNDTLILKGYGKADVEWDVPMPVDGMFEIGSVTKQFTAAAILQLRDAGKLSLDDNITRWLPDFDTRGNTVTLRRLLDHTSGIQGLTEMPEFGLLVTNTRFPRDSAYALIKRYPFQFKTGEAQIYNNSAFWLLGLIVEKASGGTYEDYIEQRIFAPLGMTRSMYCDPSENVPRRVHGYQIANGKIIRAPTNVHTWPFSAGSICSTPGDMVKWLQALHGGKVLSAASYAEMITPSKLNDGTPLGYGMGIAVGKDPRGLNYIGHGGAIGGFTSEAAWYPDAKMAIVVLLNSPGAIDAGAIASELAGEVLPWTPPAPPKYYTGDASQLVGKYVGPSRGREMVVDVTQTPQGLMFSANGSPPRALPWVDGLQFRQGQQTMTFKRSGANGPVTELHLQASSAYYVLKKRF